MIRVQRAVGTNPTVGRSSAATSRRPAARLCHGDPGHGDGLHDNAIACTPWGYWLSCHLAGPTLGWLLILADPLQALDVEVAAEPLGCQVRCVLQRSRCRKVVRRSRDDRQVFGSEQGVRGRLIECKDGGIAGPNDQQGQGLHLTSCPTPQGGRGSRPRTPPALGRLDGNLFDFRLCTRALREGNL